MTDQNPQPFSLDDKLKAIINPGDSYDFIDRLFQYLPIMTVKQRSLLIKSCQAQYLPHPDIPCTLLDMFYKTPGIFKTYSDIDKVYPFLADISYLRPYIETPLFAGLILDLVRNYRLGPDIRKQMEKESLDKETSRFESLGYKETRLNYRCFLDPEFHEEALHHSIMPNVAANSFIYRRLCLWKSQIATRIFFPRSSFKMMSHSTIRDFTNKTGEDWDIRNRGIFSQKHWEKVYFETGIELEGSCEIRQRWSPAAVKPRTYACSGGTVYRSSRYLQDPFTLLVNIMPTTHHISRLNPERLVLKPREWLRIYDFTAFTSSMVEQKFFIEFLADFCEGTEFTIMDAREGLITRDFGDVFREYNLEANFLTQLSYERFCPCDDASSSQGVAGLLGVFGNLMSCTFLHGVFEMNLVEDFQNVNIAGDDGQVPVDESSEDCFDEAQKIIGIYEWKKCFRSNEPGAVALKRPIFQDGELIRTLPLVSVITLPTLLYTLFNKQDPRFTYFDLDLVSRSDRLGTLGADLLRLQRTVWWIKEALSEDEKKWFMAFQKEVAKRADYPFPNLSQCSGWGHTWPMITDDWEEFVKYRPEELTAMRCYSGVVRLPLRMTVDNPPISAFYAGVTFRSNSSKTLSFLETLGLVEKSSIQQHYFGSDGRSRLIQEFESPDVPVYEYFVRSDVPLHLLSEI